MQEQDSTSEHENHHFSNVLAEYSYEGQYPEDARFSKPWESCIQVGQGGSKRSVDGKPLQSEGFSQCSALLLQNCATQEAMLFHIDDVDLNSMQIAALNELSPGDYIARFVRGNRSMNLSERITSSDYFTLHFTGSLSITVADDLVVNTGGKTWSIVYDPGSHLVSVQSKELRRVLQYNL